MIKWENIGKSFPKYESYFSVVEPKEVWKKIYNEKKDSKEACKDLFHSIITIEGGWKKDAGGEYSLYILAKRGLKALKHKKVYFSKHDIAVFDQWDKKVKKEKKLEEKQKRFNRELDKECIKFEKKLEAKQKKINKILDKECAKVEKKLEKRRHDESDEMSSEKQRALDCQENPATPERSTEQLQPQEEDDLSVPGTPEHELSRNEIDIEQSQSEEGSMEQLQLQEEDDLSVPGTPEHELFRNEIDIEQPQSEEGSTEQLQPQEEEEDDLSVPGTPEHELSRNEIDIEQAQSKEGDTSNIVVESEPQLPQHVERQANPIVTRSGRSYARSVGTLHKTPKES